MSGLRPKAAQIEKPELLKRLLDIRDLEKQCQRTAFNRRVVPEKLPDISLKSTLQVLVCLSPLKLTQRAITDKPAVSLLEKLHQISYSRLPLRYSHGRPEHGQTTPQRVAGDR